MGKPTHSKKFAFSTQILSLLGSVISAYSTYHHLRVTQFGETDAACNINAEFSCDAVALSEYSEIFHIPLGVFGLAFFVGIFALAVNYLKKPAGHKDIEPLQQTLSLFILTGCVVSIVLGGISLFLVKVGCVTCMGIYAVNFLLAATLIGFGQQRFSFNIMAYKSSLGSGLTWVLATIAAFSLIKNFGKQQHTLETMNAKDVPQISQTVHDFPISKSKYSGIGEDYRKGPEDAPVVINKFSDFQCPACMRMAGVLDQLLREFSGKIQVVYRNYPLDSGCNKAVNSQMHPFGCKLAFAARCAGLHGKFWKFHDIAFAGQKEVSDRSIYSWQLLLGLKEADIQACASDSSIKDKVMMDADLGTEAGVNATPTLFINGRKFLGGGGYEALSQEVKKILDQQQ